MILLGITFAFKFILLQFSDDSKPTDEDKLTLFEQRYLKPPLANHLHHFMSGMFPNDFLLVER